MFIQRAVVTFTLLPIALYCIYKGELFYFLPITAVMMVATVEYSRLMRQLGWQLPLWILTPAVLVQLIAGQWPDLRLFGPTLLASLLVSLAYVLWLYERELSQSVPSDWIAMMSGILLLGWLGSHFFLLRGLDQMAWQWTMLAMVGTWMADSAAYVVGKYLAGSIFGRHRLSPRLSPNKTIEGYLGGVVLGTSFTVIVAAPLQFPVFTALILSTTAAAPFS